MTERDTAIYELRLGGMGEADAESEARAYDALVADLARKDRTIDALVAALEAARSRIAGEWWEDHPDVQQADAALALARG